jgi:hypothetical protein
MEAQFVWVEDGDDGREGTVGLVMPQRGLMQGMTLCARSYDIAMAMRPMAESHARATGHAVRLVKFLRAEVLAEIAP